MQVGPLIGLQASTVRAPSLPRRDVSLPCLAHLFGAELHRRWKDQPFVVLLGGTATVSYLIRLLFVALFRL